MTVFVLGEYLTVFDSVKKERTYITWQGGDFFPLRVLRYDNISLISPPRSLKKDYIIFESGFLKNITYLFVCVFECVELS